MKNITIRTLGGGSIGYGHFFRCLSLSKAISKNYEDIEVVFVINDKLVDLVKAEGFKYIVSNSLKNDFDIIFNFDIDLFILDTYLGDDEYLEMIKKKTKIMLIDDNNDIYDSTLVDIIYNGNIHAEKLNYPYVDVQLRLLGLKYLIMKEEYWYSEENKKIEKNGLLITTGGSDQYEIAIDIMNSVKSLDIETKVIIGPGYSKDYIERMEAEKSDSVELIYSPSSLKDYINESEIVITAGGSTVYEVLSKKSIPIIFSLADNQDLICEYLSNEGLFYLGKYPCIDYSKIKKFFQKGKKRKSCIEDIFNLVDGKGALRVSKSVVSMFKK